MDVNTFTFRVILLLSVLAIAAAVDRAIKGQAATRWKEYLFLLAGGLAGSVAGILHDQLTVTISPEYYRLGKGIEEPNLRIGAAWLGSKSGFVAGIVLAALFLFFNKGPIIRRRSLRYLLILVGSSMFFAALGAILGYWLIPVEWLAAYDVPSGALGEFRIVWGEHFGIYTGALVGTAIGVYTAERNQGETRLREKGASPSMNPK